MLLKSWLSDIRRRLLRPRRRIRARRRNRPNACTAAEIERLESRALLSGVLTDVTPATTPVALQGTSTGNIVLATFADSASPAGEFTYLNPPGARAEEPVAISGNNVVGTYWDSTRNIRHAFLFDGTTYTTLTPPGTSVEGEGYQFGTTMGTGVSGNNAIGWYMDENRNTHGFLYDGLAYTTLSPTASTTTSSADGVSGNTVVGKFSDADGDHGYLYDGSTYTIFALPPYNDVHFAGISGTNVVGYYDPGTSHGFLFDGSTYTPIDVPGGRNTVITGISGDNVVGFYFANGDYHRFLYDGATYNTSIDPPWAADYVYWDQTGTTGIEGDNIVGAYIDTSTGYYHGFLYDGATYTTIDVPGPLWTKVSAISGNRVVGEYHPNQGFMYEFAPVASDFTPSVDWGGTLVGTPTVSVQLVSQSPTGTTWQVIGNATYADTGNHVVTVTVHDNDGNTVQANHTTIAVTSLDGTYAVAPPGGGPRTLASISQSGATLTLIGASTTSATFTSPTTLLVGSSDSATYGNSKITFGSTGAFANQVWTKLDLPVNFTNPGGAPVSVTQNGTTLTFSDKFGHTSPGYWTSPTRIFTTAWNIGATVGNGKIVWDEGTVWSEALVIHGMKNGSGQTSITATPATVGVRDFLSSHNNALVHVVLTGTTNVVFVDRLGNMVLGTWINVSQVLAPGYGNQIATFNPTNVTWSDGTVWSPVAPNPGSLTVTDYTNPNGVPVHVARNDTNNLCIVDGLGRTSLGTMDNATTGHVKLYPGDYAHFSGNTVTWDDGFVWTQVAVVPPMITFTDTNGSVFHARLQSPTTLIGLDRAMQGIQGTRENGGRISWSVAPSPALSVTDYYNAANGRTAHVIQNSTNSLVFINENGLAALGTMTGLNQATVAEWGNDVATFSAGQISWSDGSTWKQTTVAAPQLVVADYVNAGNGRTSHVIETTTNSVIFVNEAGAFALGTWTSPTQANVPTWNNDLATLSAGNISWSDGSAWTLGSFDAWDNFDLHALNALFQMTTGYP